MKNQTKHSFFELAKVTLEKKIQALESALNSLIARNNKIKENLPKENFDNKVAQQRLLEHGVERTRELEALAPSPYFTHCKVEFDGGVDDMYFGKFSLSEESIYSWITPASSLRFEKPGNVSYVRPDGTQKKGILLQKDQYMITDGKIVFLATESREHERELIYQEYFSNQKKDFVLPEIVAQMEKAQDTVIRANHRGPLVISGPAGSGKTTLALHRVAYLAQSPDVSDKFPASSILVFVQDEGTKEYFSHLLPQLGIKGVHIKTFASWAFDVLGIKGYTYVYRFGNSEKEKDEYEFLKFEVLGSLSFAQWHVDVYQTLEQVYGSFTDSPLFAEQRKKRVLDRFDITILLTIYKKAYGRITLEQEYYQTKKKNEVVRKRGRFPITYSLIIFDEFQNYLPEQIRIAKSTLDGSYNAVMYVGDMAQQTQFGTIRAWEQIEESVSASRQVMLHKVYRNTRQILEYIASLRYDITVGENVRNGEEVVEKQFASKDEETAFVKKAVEAHDGTVGILAKNVEDLKRFESLVRLRDDVHIFSIHEAQGVEFDMVCLVGVSEKMFETNYSERYGRYKQEKQQVNKDLLYVGLTRAMNNLCVTGSALLSDIVQEV